MNCHVAGWRWGRDLMEVRVVMVGWRRRSVLCMGWRRKIAPGMLLRRKNAPSKVIVWRRPHYVGRSSICHFC